MRMDMVELVLKMKCLISYFWTEVVLSILESDALLKKTPYSWSPPQHPKTQYVRSTGPIHTYPHSSLPQSSSLLLSWPFQTLPRHQHHHFPQSHSRTETVLYRHPHRSITVSFRSQSVKHIKIGTLRSMHCTQFHPGLI